MDDRNRRAEKKNEADPHSVCSIRVVGAKVRLLRRKRTALHTNTEIKVYFSCGTYIQRAWLSVIIPPTRCKHPPKTKLELAGEVSRCAGGTV